MAEKNGSKTAVYQKQIENLTKRVNDLEKKSNSQSMATWLAAIGTTLGGLGALGLGAKPAAQPPPAPVPIQDRDHKENILRQSHSMPLDYLTTELPSGSPPEVDYLVDSLKQSKLRRELFTYAVRETRLHPSFLPGPADKDPDKAAYLLQDSKAPVDLRAMSALYLGALADKRFVPLLDIAAIDKNIVGQAAKVASTMIEEGARTPVKDDLP